jgi:hypothetical protein
MMQQLLLLWRWLLVLWLLTGLLMLLVILVVLLLLRSDLPILPSTVSKSASHNRIPTQQQRQLLPITIQQGKHHAPTPTPPPPPLVVLYQLLPLQKSSCNTLPWTWKTLTSSP